MGSGVARNDANRVTETRRIARADAEACCRAARSRGRPKVLSDDERCAVLTEIATDLFCDFGYGRTSMDLVASRAHVSKQTLYRHFPNKGALFAATVVRHRHAMLMLPGDYDGGPLAEALAAIFRADLDEETYRRQMRLIEMALAEAAQFPEVLETLHRYGADPSRAELAAWLAHEMDRGRLVRTDDPPVLADILMHMIFGISKFHCLRPDAPSPSVPPRSVLVRRCIAVFLDGVAA